MLRKLIWKITNITEILNINFIETIIYLKIKSEIN